MWACAPVMPHASADAACSGLANIRVEQFAYAPQGKPDRRNANSKLSKGRRLWLRRLLRRIIHWIKHIDPMGLICTSDADLAHPLDIVADHTGRTFIKVALKSETVKGFSGIALIEIVTTGQFLRFSAERLYVSGRHRRAVRNGPAKHLDNRLRQIGTEQEVVKIIKEMRMAKDGIAGRAIALEHVKMRRAAATDEKIRVCENPSANFRNGFALDEGAHQFKDRLAVLAGEVGIVAVSR